MFQYYTHNTLNHSPIQEINFSLRKELPQESATEGKIVALVKRGISNYNVPIFIDEYLD